MPSTACDHLPGQPAAASAQPRITGLGLVTPLGADVAESWNALLAGRFVRDHARASVESEPGQSRVMELALRAGREAVGEAGWGEAVLRDEGTALVFGTSKGPILDWIQRPDDLSGSAAGAWGMAGTAAELAGRLGVATGPRLTLSAACASGLHALVRGVMMIQAGAARRVLVVSAEASLHPLFIGSFRRLGVLAPESCGCRPFDQRRNGFAMSEAAAAVCLEADPAARAIAVIERARIASDPSHLTRPDDQGEALRSVLEQVVGGRSVDLIHAHGTGTPLNDRIELAAIESALSAGRCRQADEPVPLLYSHKGAVGHSLGAAGLVAVVVNCLCHRQGIVPGNVRTKCPLEARRVRIASDVIQRPVRRSVCLAAGFGGALAAVSLTGITCGVDGTYK